MFHHSSLFIYDFIYFRNVFASFYSEMWHFGLQMGELYQWILPHANATQALQRPCYTDITTLHALPKHCKDHAILILSHFMHYPSIAKTMLY